MVHRKTLVYVSFINVHQISSIKISGHTSHVQYIVLTNVRYLVCVETNHQCVCVLYHVFMRVSDFFFLIKSTH